MIGVPRAGAGGGRLGLAFLGAGSVVRERHIPSVLSIPGIEVRAVYDPDRRAAEAAAQAAGARVAASVEEAVRAEGVDAVAVASPNALHREGVEAAAAAGKHVLCEKPIATTLRDARAMIAAAERARVVLQIGFHHRFTSEFRLARRLLESGVIGRVRALQAMISEPISLVPGADNYRLKPELAGGLTLIDFGSHRLDQLRALAGEFAEIQAQFGSVGKHRQDDNVALLVRTRDDALGTISFHRYSQGAVSPTYLIGEKGVLCYSAYVVNPFHACPVAVFTAEPVPADLRAYARLQDWWSPPPPGWVGFHPPMENPYRLEYEAFFDAVRNGGRPPVTGEDGYRTLEIVLGAYQAFATGHPVELPLDPSADIPIPRFR